MYFFYLTRQPCSAWAKTKCVQPWSLGLLCHKQWSWNQCLVMCSRLHLLTWPRTSRTPFLIDSSKDMPDTQTDISFQNVLKWRLTNGWFKRQLCPCSLSFLKQYYGSGWATANLLTGFKSGKTSMIIYCCLLVVYSVYYIFLDSKSLNTDITRRIIHIYNSLNTLPANKHFPYVSTFHCNINKHLYINVNQNI